MSENCEITEILIDDGDNPDLDFLSSSQSKPRRQRKSTAGVRKIQHVWTDDEINRLIASVEQNPGLWDIGSAEYKLVKLDMWRSVVDELGIDGMNVNEAKLKWSSLRTTFMVNLAKLRKKKSGQGVDESQTVVWKFFKSMMFLEANNINHSTSSTSTLQLASPTSDSSYVAELSSLPQASTPKIAAGNRRKRPHSTTPSPSPSTGSSSAQAISILNSAVAALHSSDTNSTFCDNLLAELRTLSEPSARTLRYKISLLMIDFMEEVQEPRLFSPVIFFDETEQELECLNTIIVDKSNIDSGQNASAFARPMPLRLLNTSSTNQLST